MTITEKLYNLTCRQLLAKEAEVMELKAQIAQVNQIIDAVILIMPTFDAAVPWNALTDIRQVVRPLPEPKIGA